MNRKIYWLILLNPVFLVLYGYGLSVAVDFCKFGGVARRLPLMAGIFAAGALWFIIWTVVYFIRKRRSVSEPERVISEPGRVISESKQVISGQKRAGWMTPVLLAECGILLLLTGYGGYQIYQSAQPYNGKLWFYLHERQTTERVVLEDSDRDFLENGLDGIMTALEEQCGLDPDWALYTANTLKVTMDEAGKIRSFDAFLYAFDDADGYHAWLVTFDAANGNRMSVYLDNRANTDYPDQERLSPLFDMIDALLEEDALLSELGFETETDESEESGELGESGEAAFTLYYSGYEDGNYQTYAADRWYEPAYESTAGENSDAAGGLRIFEASRYNGEDDGFLLTLYRDGTKQLTVIAEADTLEPAAEIQARESQEAEIAAAKAAGSTLISDDNGMTFYLDESTSMRLIVVDAAAGSRAYAFENGEIRNKDPFLGGYGVAQSIYFLDEKTGFLLLSNASQDYSRMYYTTDGGESFEQIVLPTADGEEDIAGNELGITAQDMDYIYTPYEEDGVLYVEVSYEPGGRSYMAFRFRSEDGGASWQYVSCQGSFRDAS